MPMARSCDARGTAVLTVATSRHYLEAAYHSSRVRTISPAFRAFISLHGSVVSASVMCTQTPRAAFAAAVGGIVARWPHHFAHGRCLDGVKRILKTQALVLLLSRGLHVLVLDADRRMVDNPLPALEATGADVAGMRDEALLNFGLVYLRNKPVTIAPRKARRQPFCCRVGSSHPVRGAAGVGAAKCFRAALRIILSRRASSSRRMCTT